MHADILALVLTGTALNVVGHYLTATGFAAPSAQAIPWVRYGATLTYAGLVRAGRRDTPPLAPRQRSLLTLIGALETAAYTLFTLGFYACGPATASLLLAAASQVLTAASSHWFLGKRLNARQVGAIAVILGGLAVRGSGGVGGNSAAAQEQWVGTLCLLGSAALYTAMGMTYEALLAASGSVRPAYADVSWHSSKLGFLLTSLYMAFYTLPRASSLLSFSRPGATLGLVGAFAVGINVHMACQAHVFGTRGALGVSLSNALRGAVLTLVTAALFCSPDKPWLCINQRSALSVAITLLGGYLWGRATTPPPRVAEPLARKDS